MSTANNKPKKKKKLSAEEKEFQKEQGAHKKSIRALMENIGFKRVSGVENKHFEYKDRMTELDDVFYYENIIILMEYTIGKPGDHLLKKKIIYDNINCNTIEFIDFLQQCDRMPILIGILQEILKKYTLQELRLKVVYASKQGVSEEHKKLMNSIIFFDFSIVKYFESIAKIIKRSSRFEFFDFLNISLNEVGENIQKGSSEEKSAFLGQILPEAKSSFDRGYKIVTFYIDASSLLKRAYVLRSDGWRNSKNINMYQRLLIANKIQAMRKYLHERARVFVNNIIVALNSEDIKLYDAEDRILSINDKGDIVCSSSKNQPVKIEIIDKANIIGIIDGQHRLYAYHEGDDSYETSIANLRKVQNLLVTGILFPPNKSEAERLRFQARLFLEINATQQGAAAALKQSIEEILDPSSAIAIAKSILAKLNDSGPLANRFERYWFENQKLKTSSIISFGIKLLIKREGNDTLFALWDNKNKEDLKSNRINDLLLNDYQEFCATCIRDIFSGIKGNLPDDAWQISGNKSMGILNVTTINGVINCLRLLIENNKTGDREYYLRHFENIGDLFNFKMYKSSQYRKMGEALYVKFFSSR